MCALGILGTVDAVCTVAVEGLYIQELNNLTMWRRWLRCGNKAMMVWIWQGVADGMDIRR